MSPWYVFNAIGMYAFSPADPEYIVSVPLFNRVTVKLGSGTTYRVVKKNSGAKIESLRYGGKPLSGFFIPYDELRKGKELVVKTN